MANVYFGKMNNAEQCRSFVCGGGEGIEYFGGIQPGDYALIRLVNENTPEGEPETHTHRLWKLIEIELDQNNNSTAKFDEVFTFNSIYVRDIPRLTLFKLTTNSVVFTTRQSKKVGFHKLELVDENNWNSVIATKATFNDYLADQNNYRNIVFIKDLNVQKSDKDIQLYKDSDGLYKLFNGNKPFMKDLSNEFDSSRYNELVSLIGRGRIDENAKRPQKKVKKWLEKEGDGIIKILDLWDLFCSKQKLDVPDSQDDSSNSDESESEVENNNFEVAVLDEKPLNIILYGPPGTGKTYNTIKRAVAIAEDKTVEEVERENYSDVHSRFVALKNNNQVKFVTFHQSYGYEDFIEGIKPDVNSGAIKYIIERGVFKELCDNAKDHPDKNYCFVIDEINRGNISKIFGELITLIEPEKRLGADEELECELPYSKKPFGVPKNVYIVGTMNTADRSLVHLDAALRRRFDFEEMMPNYPLLKGLTVGNIEIDKVLKAINDRICALLDREHQIGHSYFLKLKENNSLQYLNYIFKNKIIPLLQEYFYEDYSLIKKVLCDDNDFIIEDQSAYLYSLEEEAYNNYRVPSLDKFPTNEIPYIRMYKKLTNVETEEEQA